MPRQWLLLLLLPAYLWVNVAAQSRYHYLYNSVRLSLADCFVEQNGSVLFCLMVLPVLLLALQWSLKNDLVPAIILRQKSRRAVWLRQIRKIGVWAIVVTVCFEGILGVCGMFFSTSWINWDSQTSVFFIQTQQTLTGVSLAQVAVSTGLCTAVLLFTTMALFVVCWWGFGSSPAAWLTVIAAISAALFIPWAGAIVGLVSLSFHSFLTGDWWLELLGPAALGTVWSIAGLAIATRKEFLHDGFAV